jgi:uncharacterized OB-fold protein
MISSGERVFWKEAPNYKRNKLIRECRSCGKLEHMIPFTVHCEECKKKPEIAELYYKKSHTKNWLGRNQYGI